MIPARLGSKRVHNKNLRLIDGIPLISFIVEAVIKSGAFNKHDIYINSESDLFEHIAQKYGIQFYKRPEHLSTDEYTNDDFALDFLENIDADILYQFLPTSPFIAPAQIKEFVSQMKDENLDTLVSLKEDKIECLFNGSPINFDQKKKTPPSQNLIPVHAYACGMMAWRKSNFISNIKKYGAAYHGGDGKIGFYTLSGYSTVDIDTEEDFKLAEAIYESQKFPAQPTYYDPDLDPFVWHENDVPDILDKDGVQGRYFESANQNIVNVSKILNEKTDDSWIYRVVDSKSNSCCLISQKPGEGNRRHFHPSWNEWWYIVEGEWEFNIENKTYRVVKDDIVFIPQNTWHKITAAGNKRAVRLAVSRDDVKHSYDKRDYDKND